MLIALLPLKCLMPVGKPTAERKTQVSNLPEMNLPLLYI